jgi:hypothetical protein
MKIINHKIVKLDYNRMVTLVEMYTDTGYTVNILFPAIVTDSVVKDAYELVGVNLPDLKIDYYVEPEIARLVILYYDDVVVDVIANMETLQDIEFSVVQSLLKHESSLNQVIKSL